MAAMAFLGLAHTFKRGEIIRVGVLMERLTAASAGRRGRRARVATAFTLYFTCHAISMTYDCFRFNDMAQGVLVGAAVDSANRLHRRLVILAIALIDEMVNVINGNRPSYEKEPQ